MMEIQKGIYEHYKGKRYEVIGQALHSESTELMEIYKALYKGDFPQGTLWVRPMAMFKEDVLINGKKMPRFHHIAKT